MKRIVLKFRMDNNLTQLDLAKLLKIKQQSVAQYESGVSKPNIKIFLRLMKIFLRFNFDVDPYSLLLKFYK